MGGQQNMHFSCGGATMMDPAPYLCEDDVALTIRTALALNLTARQIAVALSQCKRWMPLRVVAGTQPGKANTEIILSSSRVDVGTQSDFDTAENNFAHLRVCPQSEADIVENMIAPLRVGAGTQTESDSTVDPLVVIDAQVVGDVKCLAVVPSGPNNSTQQTINIQNRYECAKAPG